MLKIISSRLEIEKKIILDNLDLEFNCGITGIIGPNGAGKSTLLRILAGIHRLKHCQIIYDGVEINPKSKLWRNLIGYNPQSPVLYDNMSVRNYLDYMLRLSGVLKSKQIENRVEETLIQFNLMHFEKILISNLSGGVRQRAALAQAFIHTPKVVLLDEPMNNLDLDSRLQLQNMFLSDIFDRILLYVGHDLNEMEVFCSQVLILDRGRILFAGKPSELKTRANGRVRKIYSDNFEADGNISENFKLIRLGVSENRYWKKYDTGDLQNYNNTHITLEDAYHVILNNYRR